VLSLTSINIQVSTQKSELDEQKAKTLEEIAKIVTEINNTIQVFTSQEPRAIIHL
jgi:hypothetical protein